MCGHSALNLVATCVSPRQLSRRTRSNVYAATRDEFGHDSRVVRAVARLAQCGVAVPRYLTTPSRNICTEMATSSMPIKRSNAARVRSPSNL